MPIDLLKFATQLRSNADKAGFGKGKCAYYVRLALASAGATTLGHPVHAKDWGPLLVKNEFGTVLAVTPSSFTPELGDIAVIQATSTSKSGHIQGYDGRNWISDFVQKEFWPGPTYRTERPAYVIYRR